MIGSHVVVRTYSAGVHFGELVRRDGKEVELRNARRIWRWKGANTCSEIALHGVSVEYSRVAEPVSIVLTEAIEIISATDAAIAQVAKCGWSND